MKLQKVEKLDKKVISSIRIYMRPFTLVIQFENLSNNKNEVIRAVLNLLFYFFLRKYFTPTKSTKKHKKHEKHKKRKNANKRVSDFFRLRCFLCA